jgi:hypothetical protein
MSTTRRTNADKRNTLADPTYTGDDYAIDTMIESGPLGNRRCTDILCLLIFFVACGGIGFIGYYAFNNGDPDLILAPMDADGNFCGKTPGYENYPYLYY